MLFLNLGSSPPTTKERKMDVNPHLSTAKVMSVFAGVLEKLVEEMIELLQRNSIQVASSNMFVIIIC